jgi:hypothetical protein
MVFDALRVRKVRLPSMLTIANTRPSSVGRIDRRRVAIELERL